MQFYLTYTLDFRPNEQNRWVIPRPTSKADLGNCFHKAFELLARKKLAIQNKQTSFQEDELKKTWDVDTFTDENAFEESWLYYSKVKAAHWGWGAAEYNKVRGWYWDSLQLNGAMWHPMNRDVVMPEQYFDFAIEKDWARYSYVMQDGKKIEGYLGLKGTVDLITRVSSNTLEYVDYKTGMRKDWATGKQKDWKKLRDDSQMRIYHYALDRLYPETEHFIITILYSQDGGAYSLDFNKSDLVQTEKILRNRFETIRDCQRPPRIISDPVHKWKCQRLCSHGMNKWENTDKTVCNHIHQEIISLGLDKVTAKYVDTSKIGKYTDGGGRTEKESK
jgi:hypothetical protein